MIQESSGSLNLLANRTLSFLVGLGTNLFTLREPKFDLGSFNFIRSSSLGKWTDLEIFPSQGNKESNNE